MTAAGIETAGGREREVDAVILATGFRLASDPENYRRSRVLGADGFDLATHYEHNRLKAYESISMPGLPNHFIVFGPYGFTGGSWFTLVENSSRHIVRVLAECRRRGATRVEITPEATDRFHAMVKERMPGSLWFNADCTKSNSYYYDHHGDAPYLRPTSSAQARRASKGFPLEDYAFAGASGAARARGRRRYWGRTVWRFIFRLTRPGATRSTARQASAIRGATRTGR